MKISRILKDVKEMRIQGAREVAKAGIRALEIASSRSRAKSNKQFLSDLQKTANLLKKTRPTEPALRNALNHVLLKVNEFKGENFKKYAISVCKHYLQELENALIKIAEIGSGQIEDGDRILTHCHSHSVVKIFREAKRNGRKFEVIVTETRPLYQGVITAKKLSKSGIKVTFCIDSAMGRVMRKADKVLVGCDAILADGSIVNKIGTFPIALVADKFGVPFLVSAGTYKFDPQTVMGIPEPIERRDIHEVIDPKKLPKARIINPAFDITPAEYIQALITEKGIMRPELVRRFFEV